MPVAVYVLGLAIFAQGTSELMLAGLLPQISSDLGVSIPDAGLLISAFAVGMLVGAPVLAAVTLRWSRRTTMLTFLAIFVVTHVLGATASSFAVLLATRVAGAFVYAGFVEATGLAEAWVPAVLALYGLGSLVGITIGGRHADANPFRVLVVGLLGMVAAAVALALTAQWTVAAIALAVLLGGTGFAINPVLNARVITLASDAPTLAAGMNVSSFNVGITVGPVGGRSRDRRWPGLFGPGMARCRARLAGARHRVARVSAVPASTRGADDVRGR